MTPENLYQYLKQRIKKEWCISFMAVIVLGLITHLYKFTNNLPNWDSLNNFYSSQNTIHLGRCFLILACGVSSYYDLYWLNGLLSLLYIGIAAVLICEMLELKRTASIILTSGLLITFPVVACTFTYMYTADGYFLGMLCMTLAVFLTVRHPKGVWPGIALMCFGLGIYQAYVTFAILFILIWSLKLLLIDNAALNGLYRSWGKLLLCGGCGAALYFLCNKLLLFLEQKSLADYQGISDAAAASSFNIPASIKQCLIDFVYFFIGPLDKLGIYAVLNVFILLSAVVFSLFIIFKKKIYKEPARFILVLLCTAAIPFGAFIIYFVSPQMNYHMLMLQSLCFVYIYLVLLYENMPRFLFKNTAVKQWAVLALTSLVIYNFILTANISYQTLQLSYEKSYGMIQRIAGRIENTPGAEDCRRLAVIGILPDSSGISLNLPPDMTGFTDGYIMSTPLHFQSMLQYYCGLDYELADIRELPESVSGLAAWPSQNSILVYDDILIIKIGAVTENGPQ